MRRNFGLLARKPVAIIQPLIEKPGRTLPVIFKLLPVIVVQWLCRARFVRRLNGTYAQPFRDVLIERPQ